MPSSAQVLYKMMNSFAGIMSTGASPAMEDCLMGLLSFCTIALGGLLIGDTLITSMSHYSTTLRSYNWRHHRPDHQVHQGGAPVPRDRPGASGGAPRRPHHRLPRLHVRRDRGILRFLSLIFPVPRNHLPDWLRHHTGSLCLQKHLREVRDNHHVLYSDA